MIGYPTRKKQAVQVKTSTINRGMDFEKDINLSNDYYRANDKAIIYKKPTPIQIVKVDYPSRNKAKIVEAYYKVPSTTDYNGIYRGKYIDFEAKQIASKKSFPLAFIHNHQIEHLKNIIHHGGIGFVLLHFSYYDEVYLIDASYVIDKYENSDVRSLTYEWVQKAGHLVKIGYLPRIDYLKVVDDVYFKGD